MQRFAERGPAAGAVRWAHHRDGGCRSSAARIGNEVDTASQHTVIDMFFPGFTLEHVAVAGGSIRLRRGGSGPPLLLLHGNPQTHAMWHAVAPTLAERFTVVCPDLRGYGGSLKPEATADHAPYAKTEMAHDMVEVMQHFGHRRFLRRQPRPRRARGAPPGARFPRARGEARRARHRADHRALRARRHGLRARLLPLVLVRPAAPLSRSR